ncbi:MAG: amidohydrolase family protein [Alphaproteobacteria bacterium]|nr:amidohydrolase family protein [Alphaproteobacteria bacterium]
MTTVDIHTHMFGNGWLDMIKEHGSPAYAIEDREDNRNYLIEYGTPACALEVEAFDYAKRVEMMDRDGVDISIVSLTSPNVHFGDEAVSVATARLANDEMAAGQAAFPDRIRWFASLPWEYPDAALAELDRCVKLGAVGVMCVAHIGERHLIDPLFAPVWQELHRRAFPVLVHPTAPLGAKAVNYGFERILMPAAGFMYDTTIAIARMAIDGFFERFSDIKIIVSHGGGYIPFVNGRVDMFFGLETLAKFDILKLPSDYFAQLYYDAIVYDEAALQLVIDVGGPDKVMFGTDLPMPADVGKLFGLLDGRPAGEVAAIRGDNAVRVFGL